MKIKAAYDEAWEASRKVADTQFYVNSGEDMDDYRVSTHPQYPEQDYFMEGKYYDPSDDDDDRWGEYFTTFQGP